ncbi:pyrroloquinoline quinone biosynthesis peptide chaperone PqqD [Aquincola sp. S2]|uniref:Pyrroloquinoline quinone biosynthesis peptide chaperone PqqD n=1 Tax=Pseudaquabacterium terrae TaxID=2732868 RepID=A0ABX2EQW4_9BURK|nr:pyrroloquinoline quinone biosynthesis peptide chaperone PqqD [Aquabacterium terrae]NRF70993.1 pyrroloquinoline quinone biosynthesis peptide chaperone PqqD [Aquabacterium terrae]
MSALQTRPAVAAMFRLQFEPAQDCWVLLYPEGMVKLNTPAAEILRRCDGRRSVEQIVDELEQAFAQAALRDDVCTFIDEARQRGWLQ